MISPTFRHVLTTRFNVEIGYASSDKGIEDEWLQDRMRVFDRLTVPSIATQSSPLDAWLVFFNAKTPRYFRDLIMARDDFTPIWVDGPFLDSHIVSTVHDLGLADRTHLITSRVDNDDALASDFIETVQEQFDGQERLFIEFPRGIEYSNGDYYRKTWRSNPFLSLIEFTGNITTVNCRPHPEVLRHEPTRSVWTRPMWLQNSHRLSTTSSLVRNARPILRAGRPDRFLCNWDDDGGQISRRVRTALRSAPRELARAARDFLR